MDVAALANADTQATRGKVLLAAHAISQQAYDQLVANQRQAAADISPRRAPPYEPTPRTWASPTSYRAGGLGGAFGPGGADLASW